MNQTRKKDHQASSGRESTSRRRAEAGVDEAIRSWRVGINVAASKTQISGIHCAMCLLGVCVHPDC
jgi:hypothetical protein